MIKGVGIDLLEIERMNKALERDGFLVRYFTEAECLFFEHFNHPGPKVAGNFAVKEAVVKVLGIGFGRCQAKDIEVLRDGNGKPYITLYGETEKMAKSLGIDAWHISISNTKDHVTAVAIGE